MPYAYRWLNAAGLLIALAVNALAMWLPLGGKTTGELSAQYPVLITPAPYAFSIWSLIYLLLIGFVIYQLTPRGAQSRMVTNIGPWFLISCLLNAGWIIVWHYEFLVTSVFVMFALLLSLIAIYTASRRERSVPTSAGRLLVLLPFSIYMGWICNAAIVNVAVMLYAAKWNGFGLSAIAWTITLLIVALLLALGIGFGYRDPFFMLVFVWAFIAIGIKDSQPDAVMLSAFIGAGLIAVCALYLLLRGSKKPSNVAY
jgi:benzodiazapine receptor